MSDFAAKSRKAAVRKRNIVVDAVLARFHERRQFRRADYDGLFDCCSILIVSYLSLLRALVVRNRSAFARRAVPLYVNWVRSVRTSAQQYVCTE